MGLNLIFIMFFFHCWLYRVIDSVYTAHNRPLFITCGMIFLRRKKTSIAPHKVSHFRSLCEFRGHAYNNAHLCPTHSHTYVGTLLLLLLCEWLVSSQLSITIICPRENHLLISFHTHICINCILTRFLCSMTQNFGDVIRRPI